MIGGTPTKKILILAANPKDTSKLRLDEEVRAIKQRLRLAQGRDAFVVESEWAVQTGDLQQALFDFAPQIVHFCGHGEGESGLAFENATGQMQLVGATALADLFKLFKAQVECVLLNACYSERQAAAIAKHIPYVVGMQQAIGDRAAIAFADGFYGALGAGRSVEDAFAFGRNRIQLETIPEHLTPVLKAKRKPKSAASQPSASQPAIASMPKSATGEPLPTTANPTRVFISYRTKEPDMTLAQEFYEALQAAGHHVFLAGESIRLGENWSARIDQELERCDYFLLLLSPQSATSEMVTEEVRRAKQLQDMRPERKPVLLPIRVNFPFTSPLNYDLRGYLQRIQQREWKSPADTPKILAEITSLLNGGQAWDVPRDAGEGMEMVRSTDDRPEDPPLPVAEPELQREPGGSVPLTSGLYVERSTIETDCFRDILQPGALIRIKAPRQMGKTSLMARVLDHAKAEGCQTVGFSFQRANSEVFSNLDQLLYWFCQQVGRRFQRLTQLEERWSQKGWSKDKCSYYFLECLLEDLDTPLVVGMDEVDRVFPHRVVVDDFFGLLRSWFEAARMGDIDSALWSKLRLVLVHSTEVYVPLDIQQSPFNVGKNVELPEFSPAQVRDLAGRYGLPWREGEVESLMTLVGGHPYLVRKALYHLRRQDVTLAQLEQTAPTEAGIYSDHLRRHRLNLQTYPALAAAMRQVVVKGNPVDLDAEIAFKLESMGLITLKGNAATARCDLYRLYFRDHLRS